MVWACCKEVLFKDSKVNKGNLINLQETTERGNQKRGGWLR